MKNIQDSREWVLAACNGRMYLGQVFADVADHEMISLDPAYEMVVLQTPQGAARMLQFPFVHPSLRTIDLPNATYVQLSDLWASEIETYDKMITQAEQAREQARIDSFQVKIISKMPEKK